MAGAYKNGQSVILWGTYIAKVARVKTTDTVRRYQVRWQHPSESGDQLTWVDETDIAQKF